MKMVKYLIFTILIRYWQKYHTVETIPKSNIDTPNSQLHDRPLCWLGTTGGIGGENHQLIASHW